MPFHTDSAVPAPAVSDPPVKQRLGELLVDAGRLNAENLARALELQQSDPGVRLGEWLVRLGFVAPRDIAAALARQFDLPLAEPGDYPDLPLLEERVAVRFLRSAGAMPLAEDADTLTLAMTDPGNQEVLEAFRFLCGRAVAPRVAVPDEFETAFERLYGAGKSAMGQIVEDIDTIDMPGEADDVQQLKDLASEAPVIRLVGLIMRRALETRASDIHVEPFENRLIVRYRIDGVMQEVESPPRRLAAAVISRIKIMANLDIAERRLPQDGRIKLRIQGKEVDLRVSTVPTMHGESVVMRILDKGSVQLDFTTLGIAPDLLATFTRLLDRPHGILLVTGPTGSGKTTTLYSVLNHINSEGINVMTLEDPVEYPMPLIRQTSVADAVKLDFANGVRSMMRQDPDVILVGEIRDAETAEMAFRAAMTGHQVYSTLHTNSAIGAIPRLLDIGILPDIMAGPGPPCSERPSMRLRRAVFRACPVRHWIN